MALSIMYTPYAEQTIAALLYELFTIPLLFFNSKRFPKSTNFFWIGISAPTQSWPCCCSSSSPADS